MFCSCKLLFVLLYFVFLQNVVRGFSVEEYTSKMKEKDMSFAMEDQTASLNWPLGIVPYYLDSSAFAPPDYILSYNLRKAMGLIASVSCVQFKELMQSPSENLTWINITNPNRVRECEHEPREGKPGEIVMVLGFDCLKQKQILHTLLHAIGFKDEVTHPLRDQYIHVLWDNIQPKYLDLFRTRPNKVVGHTLFEYDPASIMHFHDRAFSRNGHPTIQPLILPTNTLSALDKLKFRQLFDRECNKRSVVGLKRSCKKVIFPRTEKKPCSDKHCTPFYPRDILKQVDETAVKSSDKSIKSTKKEETQ